MPEMTLREHRESDFLEADIVVYSSSVNPHLPQLEMARTAEKKFILSSPLQQTVQKTNYCCLRKCQYYSGAYDWVHA